MTVTGLQQLYYSAFGNQTTPSYTNLLETAALSLYLLAPRWQAIDWDLLGRLGAGPLYVVLFVVLFLFKRGDIIWKVDLDRAIAAAEKLLDKVEKGHTVETEALRAAQQREREHFEARRQEDRAEIEEWKQRWAKAAGVSERAVELLTQKAT